MNKAVQASILAVVIAFVAGIATGWGVGRVAAPEKERQSPRAWLSQELKLSPEQETKMAEIWSSFAESSEGGDRSRWRQLYEEREQRVRDMLSEEQRAEYDAIRADWEGQREALHEERDARRDAAVEATMAILDDAQKTKYREMLDDLDRRGGPSRGPRRGWDEEKKPERP